MKDVYGKMFYECQQSLHSLVVKGGGEVVNVSSV